MTERRVSDKHEDHQLVQAAQADLRQFTMLYDRYFPRVYRYIAARVHDRATAEDLTSRVFLAGLENLHRYRSNAPFAAWLFTIAHNTIVSHFRRERTSLSYDEALDSPTSDNEPLEQVEQAEELAHLRRLLSQLNPDDVELLTLRFAAGLTYHEIARVLGRSKGAVKMAIHRLLKRLKKQYQGEIYLGEKAQ